MGRRYEGNGKNTERVEGKKIGKRTDLEDGGWQEEVEKKRGSEGG
jgi:hypothetical protein